MNENPYSQLFKVFDKEIDSNIRLGIVKSLSPFVVEVGELVLDKDNLLVNPELITSTLIKSTTSTVEQHSHTLEYKTGFKLKVGDTVLILRDNQTYIVVCKVVNA